MNALLWIIVVLASLFAATYLIAATVAAVRTRVTVYALVAVMVLLALVGVAARHDHPLLLLAVAAGAAFAGRVVLARTTRNANHAGKTLTLSAAHLSLLAGSFLFLIPFAWLISTSLKTDEEQAVFPPVWIPTQQVHASDSLRPDGLPIGLSLWTPPGSDKPVKVAEVADLPSGDVRIRVMPNEPGAGQQAEVKRADLTKVRHVSPRWENYSEALAYLPKDTHYGLTFLGNTLTLTALSVIGTVFSSSLVAFSFARLKWPGRDTLFVVLLATMMIPGAVTMMPQFLIYRNLGWIDTLKPLWVPAFFGSAFNIFLLRQFFMSIPGELEDAAKIDGCGPFAIYWRVMLPLVKPALAAIAIMATLGAWNNFQGPLIYLSSPEKMPLAYALQLYQSQHSGEPGLLMAASTLVVLPIILLFFFTQRYFIEGVSLTGMGGR